MRSDRRMTWLQDIVNDCDRIARHIAGMTYATYARDEKTIDATERCLQRICEAARRLHENEEANKRTGSLEQLYPDVPWIDVRGIENIRRHDYEVGNVDLVWTTVSERLSPLRTAALREIKRLQTK